MAEDNKPEAKPQEDWMTRKWRPMMALMYMICCLCDFALFPIMFTVVQFWEVQAANDAFRQWQPITLQGGGLFHVAMGAVLGVSAYGRTQEKVAGASVVNTGVNTTTPVTALQSNSIPSGFNGTSRDDIMNLVPRQEPQMISQPQAGFNGKLAPPPAAQPLI